MTFSRGNAKAAKLNALKVLEIRDKYASGDYTQGRLAREYGVTAGTIFNIVNGLTWQRALLVETDQAIAARAAQAAPSFAPEAIQRSAEGVMARLMAEVQAEKTAEVNVDKQLDELQTGDSNGNGPTDSLAPGDDKPGRD